MCGPDTRSHVHGAVLVFDSRVDQWELRAHATAPNRHALGRALRTLQETDSVGRFYLHSREATIAFVRTAFAETTATGTIDHHGGYVVGPFRNVAGTERWDPGFDMEAAADAALSDRDRREGFTVRDRCRSYNQIPGDSAVRELSFSEI